MSDISNVALYDELRLISGMVQSLDDQQPAVAKFYRNVLRTSESVNEFQRRAVLAPDSFGPDHQRLLDSIVKKLAAIADATAFPFQNLTL